MLTLTLFHLAQLLADRRYVGLHLNLQITEARSGFIESLGKNFATRLDDFTSSREVMGFVKDPFWVNEEAAKELVPSLDERILHLQDR